MNLATIATIFYEVIKGTPFYVWILFVYLLTRGISATRKKELHLKKMLIMPLIFMCWGLDKMFLHFSNLGLDLFIYVIFICIGILLGYVLYSKRTVSYQNNIYYRSGSYIPLIIMLINFSVKYTLNVLLAVSPTLYHVARFCMTYSLLSGLSVGLFFGGLLQIYLALKNFQNNRMQGHFISE